MSKTLKGAAAVQEKTGNRVSGGRQRLLDAARELFWEKGFESTSPQDLYAFSGVGQGSFYHHFAGKLDLLHAVLETIAAEEMEVLLRIADAESSPAARLNQYLSQERDGRRGCKIGRFVYESSVGKPEVHGPVRRYFDALENFLLANVQAAQDAGELSGRLAAPVIANLLTTAVQGGYILARAHGDGQRLLQSLAAARSLLETLAPTAGESAGNGEAMPAPAPAETALQRQSADPG